MAAHAACRGACVYSAARSTRLQRHACASCPVWPAPLPRCVRRCPYEKRFGCSRIAESHPHNARHLQPLHLAASLEDTQALVQGWAEGQAQARLLGDSRRGFLHARVLSLFWGFADDFFISLRWALGRALGRRS